MGLPHHPLGTLRPLSETELSEWEEAYAAVEAYLQALRRAGYAGDISLECRWDDLPGQLPAALEALRNQIAAIDLPTQTK